jgi:hypothetical protein
MRDSARPPNRERRCATNPRSGALPIDHFVATAAAGGSGSGTRLRIAGSVCR